MNSNRAPVQLANAFTPHSMYDFPLVNPTSRTQYNDEFHAGNAESLMYLGAGQAGCVRNIFAVTDITEATGGWLVLYNINLRVYVDAGDIADKTAPPSANLVVDAPLHLLMGAKWSQGPYAHEAVTPTTTPVNTFWDSRRVKCGEAVQSELNASGDSALRMLFSMPFSNGILIQLWDMSLGTPAPVKPPFSYVHYDLGSPPAGYPYADWRFRALAVETSSLAHDTDHTWLNVASGAGMLVGICDYLDSLSQNSFVNNWQMKLDGSSTVNYQTSGGEDRQPMNQYFWTYQQQHTSDQGGCHYWNLNGGTGEFKIEDWDWFEDAPILWQNGAVGLYPNRDNTYTGAFTIGTLAFWYGPVQA
jgi:hypothetical protein